MLRLFKKYSLYLFPILVFFIMFFSINIHAMAFSIGFDPVSFLQNTSTFIVNKVSGVVYYLIAQKNYLFDTYSKLSHAPVNETIVNFNKNLSTTTVSNTNTAYVRPTSVSTQKVTSLSKNSTINNETRSGSQSPIPIAEVSSVPVYDLNKLATINSVADSEMLRYTNIERQKMSLKPLTSNNILNIVANARVNDLFAKQYFEHVAPDGKTVSDEARSNSYEYLYIGENLAMGDFGNEQGIVNAWMNSSEHRAAILNDKYQEMGFAVKESNFKGQNITIAVQVFGVPLSICPKPNLSVKVLIDNSLASIKKMQSDLALMNNDLIILKNNSSLAPLPYNQKVQEYNSLAKKINDTVGTMKGITDFYNNQVAIYNACVKNN